MRTRDLVRGVIEGRGGRVVIFLLSFGFFYFFVRFFVVVLEGVWWLVGVVFGCWLLRGWLIGWDGGEIEVCSNKGRPAGKRARLGGRTEDIRGRLAARRDTARGSAAAGYGVVLGVPRFGPAVRDCREDSGHVGFPVFQ